ncbi:hypothetical protein Plhal304r1_c004g0017331 [Plasmopara halstedii]
MILAVTLSGLMFSYKVIQIIKNQISEEMKMLIEEKNGWKMQTISGLFGADCAESSCLRSSVGFKPTIGAHT